MKANSLAKNNPYLNSNQKAISRVITCVASSTAVETGERVKVVANKISQHRLAKRRVAKPA
jgi:hypothetical protein